ENPDNLEEESFQTKIRQMYADIVASYPDVIKRINELPPRVKVAKRFKESNLVVFIQKGLGLFTRGIFGGENKPEEIIFENTLEYIECGKEEPPLPLSESFWENYHAAKEFRESPGTPSAEISIEKKALNNVTTLLKSTLPEIEPLLPFLRELREDIMDYKTLSDYTLRRLANLNSAAKDAAKIRTVTGELERLREQLGEHYLETVKKKLSGIGTEVIIAIENIEDSQ
ncbi:MAG: helicase, partial [Candidatus Zixiibacteriota bacterium]